MSSTSFITEAERKTPLKDKFDVIVCGSGPAGVCSAILAARNGVKTMLIENHGFLGGVWTASGVSYIHDAKNKQGILLEIIDELNKRGAANGTVFDNETMKLVLEELCEKAGVHIRLYTRIVGAQRDANNHLRTVITESKSGREAWQAEVFIDATGDGDLGAFAGCEFDYGHPQTGQSQPISMLGIVIGTDPEVFIDYIRTGIKHHIARENFFNEAKRAGVELSYAKPALWYVRDEQCVMMANHEYGVTSFNADDLTRATIAARKELHLLIESLRKQGGIWSNLRLISTGAQVGVRESRRIRGLYSVTSEDLVNGKRHEDSVCEVTFKVDIHSLDPKKSKFYGNHGVIAQPYDVPLRALIAKDVKGMLMAGRCISGDFFAHGSYRQSGNAAHMGQSAGTLAALAVKDRVLPQEVPFKRVKEYSEI